jgi:uncharacterized protein YdhG (YjbR/CyaY superfamily)
MTAPFTTIDEYLATCPEEVRPVLQDVRRTIQDTVPDATETISYRMPAFRLDGKVLVYFAAFKHHVGVYPPVPEGDKALDDALAPFKNEKGNVRFPLSDPIPLDLIRRLVTRLVEARTEG